MFWKKKIQIWLGLILVICVYIVSIFEVGKVRAHSGGAPGFDCIDCHAGAEDKNIEINLYGVPQNYTPGKEYLITLEIKSDSESIGETQGGFAVSASGGKLIVVDKVNTQLLEGYLTHTNEGSRYRSWKFKWKAPSKGTDDVTIDVMCVAANGDFSSDMDAVGTQSIKIAPTKTKK